MRAVVAARAASTLITLFGTVTNAVLTCQVVAAWRSLKWGTETEWEATADPWQINGLKIIWVLLFAYFASAAAVSAVGLVGVLKSKASYVRSYRDYSIADFCFCTLFALFVTYSALGGSGRATLCEELSHHPELMRDLFELGLSLENCDRWVERASFGLLAIVAVFMVIRLHFLLALANFYSYLVSAGQVRCGPSCEHSDLQMQPPSQAYTMHRIFMIPDHSHDNDLESGSVKMVYAPVPLQSLPKQVQEQMSEAWISQPVPGSSTTTSPTPHHSRSHHRRRSSASRLSHQETGRIKLDVTTDEPLLPHYTPKA